MSSYFGDETFEQPQLEVKFNVIPKTLSKSFTRHYGRYKAGLVQGDPGGFIMTPLYGNNADKIYRLQPRSEDVWLLTFPKCGTTWTSELLWLLMNGCDMEKAIQTPLNVRAPFIDAPYLSAESEVSPKMSQLLPTVDNMPSPRVIKSHLPFYLLPPKLLETSKVVYVARNPKDTMVSFFHHHKLFKLHDFQGELKDFVQYFMNNEIVYSPFFPHVLDAWSKRNHPNMHFMFFEDMKKDLRGEIVKVANFLNKSPSDEQLTKMTEHLKFDNFEKNESVNNEAGKTQGWMNPSGGKFIRKGKTGDWKNYFNPELNSHIDEWIAKNLAGTDLNFVTELDCQD